MRLLIASADGYVYFYAINSEGGDCTLLKQHRYYLVILLYSQFFIRPIQLKYLSCLSDWMAKLTAVTNPSHRKRALRSNRRRIQQVIESVKVATGRIFVIAVSV